MSRHIDPVGKYRGLAQGLVEELSGNYSVNEIDQMESLKRILVCTAPQMAIALRKQP